MPNWKKLIVSGSDASLNTLTTDGDITLASSPAKIDFSAAPYQAALEFTSSASQDKLIFRAGTRNLLELHNIGETGAEVVINEESYDVNFKVEGNSDSSLFFVNGGTDRVGVGTINPVVKFHTAGVISGSNVYTNAGELTPVPDNLISASAEGSAQGTIALNGSDVNINDLQTDDSPTFAGLTVTGRISGSHIESAGDITGSDNLYFSSAGTATISYDSQLDFYNRYNGTADIFIDSNGLNFKDFTTAFFGTDYDFSIDHSGTDATLRSLNGNINIINEANDKDIVLSSDNGSGGTTDYVTLDGSDTQVHIHRNTVHTGSITIQSASTSMELAPEINFKRDDTASGLADFLGRITFENNDTHDNSYVVGADIVSYIEGSGWSSGSNPANLLFRTRADGDTLRQAFAVYANKTAQFFGDIDANNQRIINCTSITDNTLKVGSSTTDEYIDFGTDAMIKVAIDNVEDFRFSDGGTFHANADVVAYSSTVASDERLKTNIVDTKYGLDHILKLESKEFDWKEKLNKKHDIGFIAQQVQEVVPELVKEVDGLNGEDSHLTVDYAKVVPILVNAIKELKKEIDILKEEI